VQVTKTKSLMAMTSGSRLRQLGQRALSSRQLLVGHPLPQRKTQNRKRIRRQGTNFISAIALEKNRLICFTPLAGNSKKFWREIWKNFGGKFETFLAGNFKTFLAGKLIRLIILNLLLSRLRNVEPTATWATRTSSWASSSERPSSTNEPYSSPKN